MYESLGSSDDPNKAQQSVRLHARYNLEYNENKTINVCFFQSSCKHNEITSNIRL